MSPLSGGDADDSHCTFADTVAAPLIVNVQLFVLELPLEQAPLQITLRPSDAVSLIDVPIANDADPLEPVTALIPAGLDVMVTPSRPLALTVNVAVCDGGGAGVTVSVAVRVTPA